MSDDALNTRIVKALERLWEGILEIRQFSTRFIFFQSILLPEEYSDVISGKAQGAIPRINQVDFDDQMKSLAVGVEAERPFVGEPIWSLFSVYIAFSLRQVYKIHEGLKNGKLHAWNYDTHGQPDTYTEHMLSTIFTEEEKLQIYGGVEIGVTARFIRAIEAKILNEMNDWIFNRRFHKLEFDKQQSIQNSIVVSGNFSIGGDLTGRDKIVTN